MENKRKIWLGIAILFIVLLSIILYSIFLNVKDGSMVDNADRPATINEGSLVDKNQVSEDGVVGNNEKENQELQAPINNGSLEELEPEQISNLLQEIRDVDGYSRTSGGMQYKAISTGKGGVKPGPSDKIRIHYHSTLPDGTVLDSTVLRDEALLVDLGDTIPQWVEGARLMSVGDKVSFIVPAVLFQNNTPVPTLPPNTALTFEVELLEIIK